MSKRNVGAEEARNRLPEILEEAHHGKETVVTKRGKPYAAVVPVQRVGKSKNSMSLLALRGTGKGLWESDSAAFVRKLRDEWR